MLEFASLSTTSTLVVPSLVLPMNDEIPQRQTPDSLMLWDEANGLLFTGDMYYPGPIFLYRPETDLDAYQASLKKVAALAPRLKLLLPAHNVPVAGPSDLARVVEAMQQVRAKKINPVPHDKRWEYKFPGFSFLMRE